MRFSPAFIALAAPYLLSSVSAAPVKRAASDADVLVLRFADVLEQLETTFYQQALDKFKEDDFKAAGFGSMQLPVEQFQNIKDDEASHSVALRSVLKSLDKPPVDGCKFSFDGALKDVATMAATARVVENVGIGAYLGGATLLDDPVLLDAAGSILTIEARHQTVLNILNGGMAIPSAFDIPLAPPEVLALAGPFISGCDLGIPANDVLTITNKGTVGVGTKLEFSSKNINDTLDRSKAHCQMLVGGEANSISLPIDDCKVPDNINGPVAIWVTSDDQPLVNNVRDRAKTQIVSGPAMAFIDSKKDMLSQLPKMGGSGGSSDGNNNSGGSATQNGASSTTTQTISPEEAKSIIASASSTASGSQPTGSSSNNQSAGGPPPAPNTPGGRNEKTGEAGGGLVNVMGWINV